VTTRIAVLISGNGSNLQAIIDAIRGRFLEAQIVVVGSNRADAYGLERAQKAGIPTFVHELQPYRAAGRSRTDYDADLASQLKEYRPDWVVLAGWMHILSDAFLSHFSYRVINLHPALPGQFPGLHAIERAFEAFQRGEIKQTGVMVHLVPDEQVDRGPVLSSEVVPLYPRDTLEAVKRRTHALEHKLLVQTLDRLIRGDEE
jgi:formyltetrahydrofolate-dependent phosphoribosylglycinamide formyltransferase